MSHMWHPWIKKQCPSSRSISSLPKQLCSHLVVIHVPKTMIWDARRFPFGTLRNHVDTLGGQETMGAAGWTCSGLESNFYLLWDFLGAPFRLLFAHRGQQMLIVFGSWLDHYFPWLFSRSRGAWGSCSSTSECNVFQKPTSHRNWILVIVGLISIDRFIDWLICESIDAWWADFAAMCMLLVNEQVLSITEYLFFEYASTVIGRLGDLEW